MEAERCGLRTAVSSRISSMMPPSRTSVSSGAATLAAGVGADDVHAHLAGGVAAQHGAVLAEDHAWRRCVPRRCAQGTPAGPPPATRTSQVSSWS